MSAPLRLPLQDNEALKAELADRAGACEENGLSASAILHRQALACIVELEALLADAPKVLGE